MRIDKPQRPPQSLGSFLSQAWAAQLTCTTTNTHHTCICTLRPASSLACEEAMIVKAVLSPLACVAADGMLQQAAASCAWWSSSLYVVMHDLALLHVGLQYIALLFVFNDHQPSVPPLPAV